VLKLEGIISVEEVHPGQRSMAAIALGGPFRGVIQASGKAGSKVNGGVWARERPKI
jgi:hypothetical protein